MIKEQKCRVCGCTWNHACKGGCYWVEDDLCSECVEQQNINTCVSCGEVIPEGRQVCPGCEG